MIRVGLFLGSANISIALLSLLRNVLVARLISVEDFGIASTFAIVMTLTEMTSNIALDRLIVQARDGESPLLQATAQAIQAARGALGSLVLFLTAGPIASLFGISQLAWAYQAMALIPLLRGLAHLDMFRFQRAMRFTPSIAVEFCGQLCSTVAAVPLALKLGDYRAMLYSLLLQQIVYTVASHAVASRPYRWAWDPGLFQRAISFGWPLLVNGFLMFGIFQGDRIIVGSLLGMEELGWFSVAFSLALMPTMVVAGTLSSFFLPQLSRAQDDSYEFQNLYLVSTQGGMFSGLSLAIFLLLAGPSLLIGLYGMKYEPALPVLVLMGVMQALRLAKAGPAIVALSRAQNHNPLISNILRALMLPVAWFLVSRGAGVMTVVATGILGEGLAFSMSLYLLSQRMALPTGELRRSLIVGLTILALICLDTYIRPPTAFLVQNLNPAQIALVLALALAWWSVPALRRWSKLLLRGDSHGKKFADGGNEQ